MCVDEELAIGSAYGTAKAGIGIAGLGSFRPELMMKVRFHFPLDILTLISWSSQSLIPVVMSGIIAVYGLVVSVLISGSCTSLSLCDRLCESVLKEILSRIVDPAQEYPLYNGFVHLGAGLACGLTGMAAGYSVGYVGDAVRPPPCPFCCHD